MTSQQPLGLAILGAGIFAKEAHLPALAHSSIKSLASLRAIYSRSLKSASDFASEARQELNLKEDEVKVYCDEDGNEGLDALLNRQDIHSVIILLPIPVQPSIILKCLKAGKHVLSEKPVAPSVSAGLSLLKSASQIPDIQSGSLIWRVAENFETEPGYQFAGRLLSGDKNPIGTPVAFVLSALNDLRPSSKYYQTPWRTHPEYQGGFLLDGGVHSAAMLRTVLPKGSRPIRVSGWTGLVRKYLEPRDWMRVSVELGEDEGEASQGSNKGSKGTGSFALSFCAPGPTLGAHTNGFEIYGTEGWMDIRTLTIPDLPAFSAADSQLGDKGAKPPTKRVIRISVHKNLPAKNPKGDPHGAGEWGGEEVEVFDEDADGGVVAELEGFFKAIKGEGSGPKVGDPREALKDVALIEAALKSEGRRVDLREMMKGEDGFGPN